MEKIIIRQSRYEAHILPLGATLQSLWVPDKSGVQRDVVLGYETEEGYRDNDGYLGAAVGRCANRIAGAAFVLDGVTYPLTANEGENQLHSGPHGLHQKIWEWEQPGENCVTLRTVSPDGEDGWPGTLEVTVTYTLDDGALTIDYKAVSDRDTVCNLTNHAYFNLAGQGSGSVAGHILSVTADCYTPCGPGTIPTGEVRAVDDTALDLRQGAILGARLGAAELAEYGGYDHNFCLNGSDAARLFCPESGICMETETTMPGLQVYTAGFLAERAGKDGAIYGKNHGVCLETQFWPDAVHHEHFPSPLLRAGEVYHHRTAYRFSVKESGGIPHGKRDRP